MHILFLTDNFPPEGNAPATRTFEHAIEWVKAGNKVTVITGAPNFPEGKVFPGYKNSWFFKESMLGIEVWRVKTYITANEGFAKRILDYLSFMLTSFIAAFFVKKPDLVVATSPQFFTAVSGWAVSALRRKPFVFELRDIWPASITAVGAMSKSWIIRFLEKLELFLYRRADAIVSVTNSFKQELINRGIGAQKISVVVNGADLSRYLPGAKDKDLLERYALQGQFVVGYIGTHGLAHGLEHVVDAAELLKGRDDITFLFAGGGAAQQQIEALINEKQLRNVKILGRQDKSMMPRLWSVCDVSLVHLKDVPLFKTVIPSKIFESMAMGLPIVIGVPDGEATQIVKKHKCGIVAEPENPNSLSQAIITLYSDKVLRKELAQNAADAAKAFDRSVLAHSMLETFRKLAKS